MKKQYAFVWTILPFTLVTGPTALGQIATEFANTYLSFTTRQPVNTPAPEAAMMIDLDGDGDPDAIVANGNFDSGFTVMRNDGNGRFGPPVQYTTGFACWDITAADFTGDGIVDVAVTNRGTNYNGNTVSVFPGTGNGSFGSKTDYTVGGGPIGIAAADFNQDGFMDIVAANNGGFGSGTTVSILMNNTIGGFNTALTLPGGPKPYKVAAGRIDADNLPDIVVANEDQMITVMHNTGSGFTNTSYAMQPNSGNNLFPSLQLADIDNDQDLDIFYSSFGTQQFALRKNIWNGSLDSAQLITMDFWYGGASSFQIVDLNGDGFKDILANAATSATGDGYRFVLNLGNGQFGPETVGTGGQYTFGVMAADVDLDGDADILTLDNYSNAITVHENNGAAQFPAPVLYGTGWPSISTRLEAADIDNDGDLDVATSADSRTAINVSVAVSKNDGTGAFGPAINYSGFVGGVGVKLRDINNDGFVDLVYASGINSAPYDFYTALNNGNGTFATPQIWSLNSCGWNDLDVADLDNDGDQDVVVSEWLGCPSVPFSSRRLFICYNQGNGTFSAPNIKIVAPQAGPLAICDFNEDGFLDIANGHATSIGISINDGTGDMLPEISVPMAQSPFDILAADLNNDGHIDLASCNYGSNPGDYCLTVRLGNGDGSFQPLQLLPAAYSPDLANVSGLVAADVDNDGDVDLIVSQNATNDMSVYLNDGTGTFAYSHRLGVYYTFRSPWFGDFTGDGIMDLAGMVSLPPSGLPSALTVLPGITTGNATGGAGISACATNATGIPESESQTFTMSVYPNPATDVAKLSMVLAQETAVSWNISDVTGRVVQSTEARFMPLGEVAVNLNLSDLSPGLYFCNVTVGGNVQTIPLAKQ